MASESVTPAPAEAGELKGRDLLGDPRYKQGNALLKEKKYDEALELLGLLVGEVAEDPDYQLDAGPIYYAYGDALLEKVEVTSDLFGAGVKTAAAKEGEGDGGDEQEGGEDEEEEVDESGAEVKGAAEADDGGGKGEPPAEEEEKGDSDVEKKQLSEETQDDLEVAWENLEVARVIYERFRKDVPSKTLAEVYRRLGDLQQCNGNYSQAVEDYSQSFKLFEEECEADSRILANLHYSIAVSYIYATTEDSATMYQFKQKALEYYIKAADIFKARIARLKSEQANGKVPIGKGDDLAENEEIYQEIKESVEATMLELKHTPASAKSAMPVTTIGFGSSSASASSDVAVGLPKMGGVAVGSSETANGGGGGAAAVTVMAVKKKVKPATTTTAEANGASESAAGKKRPAPDQQAEEGPAEGAVSKAARIEE